MAQTQKRRSRFLWVLILLVWPITQHLKNWVPDNNQRLSFEVSKMKIQRKHIMWKCSMILSRYPTIRLTISLKLQRWNSFLLCHILPLVHPNHFLSRRRKQNPDYHSWNNCKHAQWPPHHGTCSQVHTKPINCLLNRMDKKRLCRTYNLSGHLLSSFNLSGVKWLYALVYWNEKVEHSTW